MTTEITAVAFRNDSSKLGTIPKKNDKSCALRSGRIRFCSMSFYVMSHKQKSGEISEKLKRGTQDKSVFCFVLGVCEKR